MPLPRPDPDEERDEFVDRCMADDQSNEDFPDPAQRRAVCERQWDQGPEEAKAMRYEHILQAIFSTPWAILPETLTQIMEIVRFRADGGSLTAEEIQQRIGSAVRPPARRAGAVAVLPLHGPIAQRMNLMIQVSGGTSTEMFSKHFRAAVAEPGIKAIVLEVDSPGGSVFGVEELADEIRKARGEKPIVAVGNSMMASAAYWIAAAAHEVVMTLGGFAGSVGVVMPHTDISGAEEKMGLKTTLITAGRFKAEASEFEPLTDEARTTLQGVVDEVYDRFVRSLATSRSVSQKAVREGYGEGRLLSATKALEAGMVDRIDTLQGTLQRLGAGGGVVPMSAIIEDRRVGAVSGDLERRRRRMRLTERA